MTKNGNKGQTGMVVDRTAEHLAAIRAFVSKASVGNNDDSKTVATPLPEPATPPPEPEPKTAKVKVRVKEKTTSTEPPASDDGVKLPDPVALTQAMLHLAERSQPMIKDFLERVKLKPPEMQNINFSQISDLWLQMYQNMLADPQKLVTAQLDLWQNYARLWENTSKRLLGKPYETLAAPAANDRRFQDTAWSENTLFDFLKQSYLLTAGWLQHTVHETKELDPHIKRKLDFYTKQFVDALSPSNYLMTNPEALRVTAETGGENLVKGLQNLLQDLERGQGELHISMTDMKAFELGKNVATTPGKVVYQNDLMQLIQYAPTNEQVHTTPLLIIPPWINKYYILDLRQHNSFVRYCLDQGHTVFIISWVNPDEKLANKDFADYMTEGPMAALEQIKKITGEEEANVIGYCLGGTLLAAMLGYLEQAPAQPQLAHIKSATYFVAMVDFKDPGDISVFIDDTQLQVMEEMMAKKGYMDAYAMATTFNMLRANDLIWNFVVNNYLLGKEPFPFDLLYWNSDSTRMPAAMHSFYLRQMYQKNKLIEAGGIKLKGVPIDLRTVATPSFIVGTKDDHITPWKTVYTATQIYRGQTKFVLSGSGHIAGIINPPDAKKYNYWLNDTLPSSPDDWLKAANQQSGSWWPEWGKWIKPFGGEMIAARHPDTSAAIEDAPGSYVKVRAI
jgi:polyhydroxyalkanoate synthase subunit PhaC